MFLTSFPLRALYRLQYMRPQLNIVVALVISLLWIQHSICDEPSDTGLNKWKCRCSSIQGKHKYSLANCSKSCDCHSDAEESASIWTCICGPNGFPKVKANGHNLSCFNACNCTSGTIRMPLGSTSKKQISSNIVVVILSICVICTTIAFLTSVVCHVWRRERCPSQSPMISSDKETSYSSTTNLISHRTSSVPEAKISINSSISHITGCFRRASFLFGSQRETFHGNIIQFSFAELENATENFLASNLVGLGGSSYVYRGRLKDGSYVAVKRLKDQRGPEADSEFFTEIELLSRLHHCHLVPLVGYCSELKGKNVQRLLVFDYMTNGNLRDRLDGIFGKKMDWSTRVTIALGAARGLEYLHEAAAPRILHRDVKSTNILLDKNWQAKAATRLQDNRRVITELADPQLKGNFPEEEMQIMAFLAKECLLLDPDTRPTMSEVVQVLSSISPGKSRRRINIPMSIFQEPEDAEKQRQAPSSRFLAHNLLPLGVDHNFHVGNENKDVYIASLGHMESLILSTSKGESLHASEDEMVDLTEPRFESFFMTNVNFP
ncbi:receptor-like serine/threonine-protein kinase NCRK isoform X5 [Abrus precatorius]|uniref:Receptor-like serine/threonine-protein kinase NCRK isoform X5 n=1 Tax=Abrus precatorius TaxID=3816 RepID=A0A8B8K9H8_ABRPR|nr:receptor-like serine/threonine-protein kinase NCRK isoform X5 [Abrus precatorius]